MRRELTHLAQSASPGDALSEADLRTIQEAAEFLSQVPECLSTDKLCPDRQECVAMGCTRSDG